MKKLIIPVIALVMAFGSSAFKNKVATSNFYKYVGPVERTQTQITTIENYEALAADPCSDDVNVCGVTLSTARDEGQHPVSGEFSAQSSNLWDSQDQGSAANSAISMEE